MRANIVFALMASVPWAALPFALALNATTTSPLIPRKPLPAPTYMVDNTANSHGVAPDNYDVPAYYSGLNSTSSGANPRVQSSSSYWLANMQHGKQPLAPSDYPVWRNVMDFGAKGDGVTDDTLAINVAATTGNRCGLGCSSTTISPAVVYFPPGTYMVSSPILQYYFTQFIGDPTDLPTIKGMPTFQGIALIDTDVYIPGGNGSEWYINQNQFFRQIRNLNIDLTAMPNENQSGDQTYVPTGIHWQVAQSTSLQNIHVTMAQGSTAVGIFTENGSGGFMSDLTFFGGNIGMRVGSQQFTARDISFINNAIAVSMIWDWGWTWKNILVQACYIAFQCTNMGGLDSQGTGSLTVLDSHFIDVPYGIPLMASFITAITLDNLLVEGNCPQIVFIDGTTNNLLDGVTGGSKTITSWATGRRYTSLNDAGSTTTGDISPVVSKSPSLLDGSGKWFVQSKPQYETLGAGSFLNVMTAGGATGDGKTDDLNALNLAFTKCLDDVICFIPHGIYMVSNTVYIPPGARIVGEAWPQIMGFGSAFEDQTNPLPVVEVGVPGSTGRIELSDLLFTVQGATSGAILVKWNMHQSSQGSAAMWDCHFRVGGAFGTSLGTNDCPPTGSYSPGCNAASMLLWVAPGASGYFENVWVWTADHYLDDSTQGQINVFTGRGLLIEQSQGPNWFWGGASEHSMLYQYNIWNSSNIFLGHMQTESPYYQPGVQSNSVYPTNFNGDPTFPDCGGDALCLMSWALLISGSTNIYIYGAGFYSWFDTYAQQPCLGSEACQIRLMQTDYSQGIWMYSQYTKGAMQAISPGGTVPIVNQADNRNGFLTAITAWLPLALTGANIGGVVGQADHQPPSNPTIDPGLQSACGNPPPGGTITISSACASAIAAHTPSTSENNPPGPEPCRETCDILRWLVNACCSSSWAFPWTAVFPPSVVFPGPINLPAMFPPSIPLTIQSVGPDYVPTETTFPANVPLPFPLVIGPGLLPVHADSAPLVVPAGTEDPPDSVVAPDGEICDQPRTAVDCIEYDTPELTTQYCVTVTGCMVSDTTTTTTPSDQCPLYTNYPGLPDGYTTVNDDRPTITAAHLIATLTFEGAQAAIYGSTLVTDLGTEGGPVVTPPPASTSPPSQPSSPFSSPGLLQIAWWSELDYGAVGADTYWKVYAGQGTDPNINVCTDSIGQFDAGDYSFNSVPYPGIQESFSFSVLGVSGCSYSGSSSGPGTLSCGGWSTQCSASPQVGQELNCDESLGVASVFPKVACSL